MENMELLQAMRQMMEEVVSPIYERMDKMQEELSSVKEEVAQWISFCPPLFPLKQAKQHGKIKLNYGVKHAIIKKKERVILWKTWNCCKQCAK